MPELSDKPAPWANMVIEGDNFDALRWLRMTLAGRVKCIYVDPPYNTGNKDWVYNDRYMDPEDRFHQSTWLEFLYRRFTLARDLLDENGVMLVSINDEQRALLELMMDEAMPGMKLGCFVWRTRKGGYDSGNFSKDHDFVLVYRKPKFEFHGTEKNRNDYSNPDNDVRGDWTDDPLQQPKTYKQRKNAVYFITDPETGISYPPNPNRVWSVGQKGDKGLTEKPWEELLEEKLLVFKKKGQFVQYDSLEELFSAIDNKTAHKFARRDLPNIEDWVGRKIGLGSVRIKKFLKDRDEDEVNPLSSLLDGVSLTPLMLVQVEDQAAGGEDPVDRVREKMIQDGVPEGAIATHTSGQPDPDFHTLAYDPDKEVLIFKVAVATGFDAPRAWTLVSVRPNRGKEFGLQIVGRIMRVHPLIRPFHGQDTLLDRGYVFLADPEMQAGLDAAVEEVKAVRQSIELITDRLDVFEFGSATKPLVCNDIATTSRFVPPVPTTPEDRQMRLTNLIESGLVKSDVAKLPEAEQDRAILAGEAWQQMTQTPLFGNLPEAERPASEASAPAKPNLRPYPLRTDIDLPKGLWRELPPDPGSADKLVDDIAKLFCKSSNIVSLLQKRKTKAKMSLRDLFVADMSEEIDLRLRLSNARVAEKAQMAFNFNDAIDPRLLKRALITELRRVVDDEGIDAEERDLRRALDLAVMGEPEKLKEAMKTAQGRNVRLSDAEPIPESYFAPDGLAVARKSAYGVFPARLNQEEQKFAEVLDEDGTGTVLWWMRNPENERWATRIVLPSGKNFFPDFVVGVAGRATPNAIALVEIKDDGETGRLQSDRNIDKIRVQHREYRNVFWTYRDNGDWVRARYAEGLHRILPKDMFSVSEMVFLE
ncbi:MAG: site-specific DNA-methyltransferase [Tritonibacter mobilis]|nr:site-specific DNA-methyltransferase [Tritonibacter mobilis]